MPFLGMACALVLMLSAYVGADSRVWTPDAHPDPQKILNDAENDERGGRYADSLAKHVWIHENALKYAPAMYGVRLSFALSSWASLGEAYPPALEKLKAVRDEAAASVRSSSSSSAASASSAAPPAPPSSTSRKDARQSFIDFAAINSVLKDDAKTSELFSWLDANDGKLAADVFESAQPSLVAARKYRLCGKYLDPDRSLDRSVRLYSETKRLTAGSEYEKQTREVADKTFTNDVATLVALLVLNRRQADAERIAAEARKVWDAPAFGKILDRALKGEVPAAWP
jgi:hypothetical protein